MLGMKRYVWTLEKMVIDLIQEWGVLVSWSPHTGVWVGKRKIYNMGVNNSNGSMVDDMTSLGLVLNCDTDLGWFDNIVPCGIEGADLTSLTELSELSR